MIHWEAVVHDPNNSKQTAVDSSEVCSFKGCIHYIISETIMQILNICTELWQNQGFDNLFN